MMWRVISKATIVMIFLFGPFEVYISFPKQVIILVRVLKYLICILLAFFVQ